MVSCRPVLPPVARRQPPREAKRKRFLGFMKKAGRHAPGHDLLQTMSAIWRIVPLQDAKPSEGIASYGWPKRPEKGPKWAQKKAQKRPKQAPRQNGASQQSSAPGGKWGGWGGVGVGGLLSMGSILSPPGCGPAGIRRAEGGPPVGRGEGGPLIKTALNGRRSASVRPHRRNLKRSRSLFARA
jgi:hypothetical protein